MKGLTIAVRVILTAGLIYFVYLETGAATTIAISLIFLASEATAVFMTKTNENINNLLKLINLK